MLMYGVHDREAQQLNVMEMCQPSSTTALLIYLVNHDRNVRLILVMTVNVSKWIDP
jgi:hypothetical protein